MTVIMGPGGPGPHDPACPHPAEDRQPPLPTPTHDTPRETEPMRNQRSFLGAVGTMTLVLASALTSGTAQAAPAATSAASPTTSPAVRSELLAAGSGIVCGSGNFCASVWDPAAGRFRVFYFYDCARYALSNWNEWGEAQNSQTGGAVARVHGSAGNELASYPANNAVYAVNWGPVYSIRNC